MTTIYRMPNESADGTPHMTYYDTATETSFVWSGSAERPIEVCPGGYGEAVTAEIDPVDVPALDRAERMPAYQLLAVFRSVCDQWLREAAQP